jgi:hypothetical protein
MIIQNINPVIVPPKQEAVFDAFWASKIIISTPNPLQDGSAFIELKPYNSSTKEVLEKSRRINVPSIFQEAQNDPAIQNAVMALIIAIDSLVKKQDEAVKEDEPAQITFMSDEDIDLEEDSDLGDEI